jgi:hypothetical protein
MAIKPPGWCTNAVPGKNGWTDPVSGEVYVSARFTQAEIDEYNGVQIDQAIHDDIQNGKIEAAMANSDYAEPVIVDEDDVIQDLNEDGVIDDLESMTKKELEDLGREHGVELDRRKNKKSLVSTMRNLLSK